MSTRTPRSLLAAATLAIALLNLRLGEPGRRGRVVDPRAGDAVH